MIQFNSQNTFKEIHYDSHDIQKVYGGCSGELVWEKDIPPVPPTPVFGKFKLTLSDSSTVTVQCDSTSAITINEVSYLYSESLVSAEIGKCVTKISMGAFQRCYNLTSVTISDSVTTIANSAFYNCSGLTSVTIPDSVTSIEGHVFENCTGLQSLTCLAITPPSLGTNVFLNTTCPIYVLPGSLPAYQSAWSNYASRIQAMP